MNSNEFVIVTDTSSDLPGSYFEKNNIPLLTLYYTIDGVTGKNGCPTKEDLSSFYAKMRSGSQPQTQQVNPAEATQTFKEVLDSGKDVLYIGFSSGLSGTVNSARIAKEELYEKYPNQKIFIIDTLCASLGQGLVVDYAVKMKEAGSTIDEIAQWIEDNKLHVCHYVTVEDLVYLQRGGRISKTAAFLGTMIGIKPTICVDNYGKLVPIGKVRGRKQALAALVDHMEEKLGSYKGKPQTIFISHADCEEDALALSDMIRERFGYEDFFINSIGPTIGSHAGPGAVVLFFLGESR